MAEPQGDAILCEAAAQLPPVAVQASSHGQAWSQQGRPKGGLAGTPAQLHLLLELLELAGELGRLGEERELCGVAGAGHIHVAEDGLGGRRDDTEGGDKPR